MSVAIRHILTLGLLLAAPSVLFADTVTPPTTASCPATPIIPPEWKGWETATALKTMSDYREALVSQWPPVKAKRTGLALHPIANVSYWATPGKPIMARTFGGMNTIKVEKAGRLKIALSGKAWIDLVRDRVGLGSVTHGHGPDCSGIAKIVEFDVRPGIYILQIVNAPSVSISAMALMAD